MLLFKVATSTPRPESVSWKKKNFPNNKKAKHPCNSLALTICTTDSPNCFTVGAHISHQHILYAGCDNGYIYLSKPMIVSFVTYTQLRLLPLWLYLPTTICATPQMTTTALHLFLWEYECFFFFSWQIYICVFFGCGFGAVAKNKRQRKHAVLFVSVAGRQSGERRKSGQGRDRRATRWDWLTESDGREGNNRNEGTEIEPES